MHLTAGSHDGNPAAEVFELTHVAWPGETCEVFFSFGAQHLRFRLQLFGRLGEEMLRKTWNIFASVAQARDVNANDVQAVEKIFPKQMFGNEQFEILVCGRDDANIHFDWRVTANPIELAVRKNSQEASLCFRRHVTNLVEKECAAIGLLEAPCALSGSAGEGAFFMTEQFRFDQIFRNRRHVERDELIVAARTVTMQSVCHQLLAGAGLTIDQHRDVGL